MEAKVQGYVYMMSNRKNGVIYVGVTRNLSHRVSEHKSGKGSQFVKKYNLHHLVYYEIYPILPEAIAREKQLKAGSRQQKLELIESMNSTWKDLSETLHL